MNYRHGFHAANFADLFKHALLLEMLRLLLRNPEPLTVIETHAGEGLYDLGSPEARRTGEGAALAAVARETPSALAPLLDRVKARNSENLRIYAGSPVLIAETLRPSDRLIAYEAHLAAFADLRRNLASFANAKALEGDGWAARSDRQRLLAHVDPPFEEDADRGRCAAFAEATLARAPQATLVFWSPIKDLHSHDRYVSSLALGPPGFIAELRIRPLDDPMRMNGCALVVINPPQGLDAWAKDLAEVLAERLGEDGARGLVTSL